MLVFYRKYVPLFSTSSGVNSFLVSGQLRWSWALIECYKFIPQRVSKIQSCVWMDGGVIASLVDCILQLLNEKVTD